MKIKKWNIDITCPCGVVLEVEEEDISYQFNGTSKTEWWKANDFFVLCPACNTNIKLFISDLQIPPAIKERIKLKWSH